MARVLLFDVNHRYEATIPPLFEQYHHTTFVATELQEVLSRLLGENQTYDVVIVDMSRNRDSDWQNVNAISAALRAPKPMMLCVSDAYVGPRMKLEVENKGGRLVWI